MLDFVYKDMLEAFQKDNMPDLQAQAARAIGQVVAECGKDCLSHDDLVLAAKAMQQVRAPPSVHLPSLAPALALHDFACECECGAVRMAESAGAVSVARFCARK